MDRSNETLYEKARALKYVHDGTCGFIAKTEHLVCRVKRANGACQHHDGEGRKDGYHQGNLAKELLWKSVQLGVPDWTRFRWNGQRTMIDPDTFGTVHSLFIFVLLANMASIPILPAAGQCFPHVK